MLVSTLRSSIGRHRECQRPLWLLLSKCIISNDIHGKGVIDMNECGKAWASSNTKEHSKIPNNNNHDLTASIESTIDAWLNVPTRGDVQVDRRQLLGREDAALEHSTAWILDLLLQESSTSTQPNFNDLSLSVWKEDWITTKRCHVVLNMLLYHYDPTKQQQQQQRMRRRDKLVPGSANRAYDIWDAMCRLDDANPVVQVDELTTRLVLQILARDNSSSNKKTNYVRALEVVQYYVQHHQPTKDEEREQRQVRWMYNQVLACHANSNSWDKSYQAMKLFTEQMLPNVDASSYSHVLRACATSHYHPKSKQLGRTIALQLWDQHIHKEKEKENDNNTNLQTNNSAPKLSPHVYRFLIQTLATTSSNSKQSSKSTKQSLSDEQRNNDSSSSSSSSYGNNYNNRKLIPVIFQHCCDAGLVNSHVLLEIIKHVDIFDSLDDSSIRNYLDKFQDKTIPPHQRAAALFRLLPKAWTRHSNSNASGW